MCFPFVGYPVWGKYTLNKHVNVFGTLGTGKAPPHQEKFFDRATILIEVIYLNLTHFMAFPVLGHPVC